MKHKVKLIRELLFYITSQMIPAQKVILAVSKYQYQEQGTECECDCWPRLLGGAADVGPAAKACVLCVVKNVLQESCIAWGQTVSCASAIKHGRISLHWHVYLKYLHPTLCHFHEWPRKVFSLKTGCGTHCVSFTARHLVRKAAHCYLLSTSW